MPSRRNARAVLTARARAPATFYARLVAQALRNGLPAARRFGRARALVARAGVPHRPLAHAVALFPRGPAPALDGLLRDLAAAWPELSSCAGLPPAPPPLTAAALRRASSLTVFVFGDTLDPLLVAKVPGDADRVADEAAALAEAEPARVSPRFLGRAGGAFVQQAVAGMPLEVEPVTPKSASRAAWSPAHGELAEALLRLAGVTAKSEPPEELDVAVPAALESGLLAEPARRALAAAWSDVRRVRASVLRHRDTSPQNCLVRGNRFAALVDWEAATSRGAPGFDTWNAALASLETGIGLVAWSDETVLASFRAAWAESPLFTHGRAAARRAAVVAGIPERVLDQLELVFFARRLGVRVAAPSSWATGPATAARMLEFAQRS